MEDQASKQATPLSLGPGKINPDAGALYRWKPGHSGNPKGRPRRRPITEQLEKIFEDNKQGELLAKSIGKWARKGSIGHVREIMDRVDGVLVRQIEAQVNITHELSENERASASNSLQKIAAFDSEAETPLIAEVVEDEENS
jgi:hypothetical protein